MECNGGKSCYGGSSTFSGGNTLTISARGLSCYGGQSCSKDYTTSNSMEVIFANSAFGSGIECDGGDSCRGPGVRMEPSGSGWKETDCNGANSCKDTIMDLSFGRTTCSGYESCADSDITSRASMYCQGTRSCRGIQFDGMFFV